MLDYWTNCYDQNWKNIITPASFSHPAKFSHGLIKRIYDHALAEGMIQPGGVVIDPFGGVSLGALYALQNGLHWIGCELESKFVELGQENIALWNSRYASHFPHWGTAQLLQGDSRRLAEVVGAAGLVVSSPPYASGEKGHPSLGSVNKDNWGADGRDIAGRRGLNGDYGSSSGQLAEMPEGQFSAVISSPPFAGNSGGRGEASRNGIDAALFDRHSGGMIGGMGDEAGNLGNLPMGSVSAVIGSPPYADGLGHDSGHPRLDEKEDKRRVEEGSGRRNGYGASDGQLSAMVVGSPPYADGCTHQGGNDPNPEYIQGGKRGAYGVAVVGSPPFADSVGSDDPAKRGGILRTDPKRAGDVNLTGTYGTSEGQLGAMKGGAVISSPPYAEQPTKNGGALTQWEGKRRIGASQNSNEGYGETAGQLAESPETFWTAARLIIEQCAAILPPGGAAIWVTKRYVKNGQIVDFSRQWAALCEACGFEVVHWHRAMLVKDGGMQMDIFGKDHSSRNERKSFFRRLSEGRTKAAAHWETLSRADQAALLRSNHNALWQNYHIRLTLFNLSDEEKEKAGIKKVSRPPRPNYKRILASAQSEAWARDGKPHYEIDTAIDYEDVICTRKQAA